MSHIGTKEALLVSLWDRAPSPRIPNPTAFVGSRREYRREDYIFARTQSQASQACEWEYTPPVRSWGFNVIADIAMKIFG